MELADFDKAANLVALFLSRADELGGAPMLHVKRDGVWQPTSWSDAARQVCLIAQGLRRIGLEPGDRVVIVSENRPEWCLADLAIMAAGCISVPAYTTNTVRDHIHILENSGARAAIVSTPKLAKNLATAIDQTDLCRHLIGMEPLPAHYSAIAHLADWASLLEGDSAAARAEVDTRVAGIGREDLACIIYTSGTGGLPRGVRQHHGMILANIDGAARIIAEDFTWDAAEDRFLSFLPLSHAYEHTGGQFLPIGLGAQIWYAEGLDKLAGNIEEVRPTIMVVVPRLFEVLRARILKQIEKQGETARRLLDWALAAAVRKENGRRRLTDPLLDLVLDRTLRPKVQARFGGRIKALVSGGAPLNPEIGVFFDALGLVLLQGYGQTEAGPVVSCNRLAAGVKMDTVGPPLRAATVRIAADGEICVQGELVMHGYWQNAAASADVLRHDPLLGPGIWLHTGDIGHFDQRGRIMITDRKKDMIVNDKGDNVSPQRIEAMLTLQPEIAQAMVAGDQRPYVVGLIVPDAEWALQWSRDNGEPFDLARLQDLPAFRSAVREAVDRVNADLSVIEKVRQFAFAAEPFSIENEEMTPSLKIRRHKIRARYGERLDGLYKG
ncbi:AMP-dependent synthetase/ligase [Novosphingobium colocasiae]|uniref:AMP-dependent synthetase n=1 Tax=Novosphingobium colocasiae TaxID=1256513 RepID=A0A918P965_9SPHN|nr:AMP-dependent synthetase/ligase [Novosphingobium colocasiae]GGY92020.1 AMP-dependent synthetase [Novosphingobium colocasiae]